MIKILLVVSVIVMVGCSAARAISGDVRQAEDTGFSVFDFGIVKEGDVLKHEFSFKNDSDKKLNINNVSTSCGCTVSKINKKTLAPAEEALIEVSFDSKGYEGEVQQFVYVETDNINNPISKFTIKAEVRK